MGGSYIKLSLWYVCISCIFVQRNLNQASRLSNWVEILCCICCTITIYQKEQSCLQHCIPGAHLLILRHSCTISLHPARLPRRHPYSQPTRGGGQGREAEVPTTVVVTGPGRSPLLCQLHLPPLLSVSSEPTSQRMCDFPLKSFTVSHK